MSGSQGTSSQLGIDAAVSSFFVLTLDIPLNVVFRAAEPLTPLFRSTPPSDVAPINSPASRSPTSVAKRRVDNGAVTREKRRVRLCEVMSRDHTPEVVRRAIKERGYAAGQRGQITTRHLMSGTAGRHEVLSRPRSRSVCGGKYCSVSTVRPAERITPTVCPSGRLRPRSAVTTRHLPANISPHHHPSTAATSLLRVARTSGHNDVKDDDTTTTSSSALGDSGVTSLVNDDITRSRDSSPWSDRLGAGMWRGEGMTDTDRQSQLRRFLDAVVSTSEENPHRRDQSDGDDDDDDVPVTETGRTSVSDLSEWQVGEDGQSGSAMDRVRHLVNRCRLPVNTCTHLSVHKPQRLDTSTYTSSMTSESIQRAILKAAADLVKLSRADERVAQQLLTLSRRIQSYKLQLYSQLHRAVIDSAAVDLDDVQPSYVDLDIDRPELLATHLLRCGITRSHLQRRRRFSIF